ncbi:porin family protein [Alteromonas pelagimontana]|uniref:Porin family protein n=1 Tax=Alteromonas pelagimontana TaxID=1858656 RepID=A0A6M4MEY8_9ALTE|nr:porin family protein [Alteromonas pelagimontana]QJR81643.1 porin family protein [Alteromonas pelagimontana]
MKNTLKVIASLTALTSSAAFAQSLDTPMQDDPGFYVGGNYGYLKVDGQDDFDDDNDVLQGLVGYRFNRYLAIEGSVVDFGDYGNEFANADTDGYTAAVKGTLPLSDRFAVYVKGGQLWWETDYSVEEFSSSYDDESLFIGAGLSYNISKSFVINAEYTVYDADLDANEFADDIDDTNFDTDLKQASIGVEYRF